MRGGLRYWIAASLLILVGAGLGLGIALSRGGRAPAENLLPQWSQYITMPDSVDLAANVTLPAVASGSVHERVPTILRITPYALPWYVAAPDEIAFDRAGFAVVDVNERGAGASLGTWRMLYSFQERDAGDIVRWITQQPWSDGTVATYGVSYDGGAAEFAAVHGGRPLKATAELFIGSDPYRDATYPGGILSQWSIRGWSQRFKQENSSLSSSQTVTGSLRSRALEAVKDHAGNLDTYRTARLGLFRDSSRPGGMNWDTVSSIAHLQAIERSGVARLGVVGWFDGGLLRGAIEEFLANKGSTELVIGPWNHGGGQSIDTLRFGDTRLQDVLRIGPRTDSSSYQEQFVQIVSWLRSHVRSSAPPHQHLIRYYVLGTGEWRTVKTWPPPGTRPLRFRFAVAHGLVSTGRSERSGRDRYPVWFGASSGPSSRWHSGLGGLHVSFDSRRSQDSRLLTYTSAPLAKATLIAGTPSVSLRFSSTSKDAAVFVYLEAVAPGGKVIYLTEGELRASDRKTTGFDALGPVHPFTRKAAKRLGKAAVELNIGLLPIAARVPAGYRLRIAIAGADAGSFERVPARGPATFTIGRGGRRGSFLSLPVMGR